MQPECLFTPSSSKQFSVEKSFRESIDFIQKIETEVAGPNEIVDVHVRLQNFAPSAPQRYCIFCQCDHKNLQLSMGLGFRNDAHVVKLDPCLCYVYQVEAWVCVEVENRLFHLNYRNQSMTRNAVTLEFQPFELDCPGLGRYDENTLIKHVCWKISKAKHIYLFDKQRWHMVRDKLGPSYKGLYWKILTNPLESCCDVLVRVGPVSLPAHKTVLCVKSPKLHEYFSLNPEVSEILFTNVYPDVVQVTLKFFYTNELDRLPHGYYGLQLCDLLIRLYYFAKACDFQQLRIACLDHIKFTVTPETAPAFAEVAANERLLMLHQSLQEYIYYFNKVQSLPQPAGVACQ
ncbi:unnamed protein product [Trichogramma brassicae]|uniref:BTB domain-containing protein n=1 Tax=Trichogramma brassicae TaxID=86971 RepID=A0A6H5HXZ0_9HYME|nr:unnamed protein product [Trichogramma brassicae]